MGRVPRIRRFLADQAAFEALRRINMGWRSDRLGSHTEASETKGSHAVYPEIASMCLAQLQMVL